MLRLRPDFDLDQKKYMWKLVEDCNEPMVVPFGVLEAISYLEPEEENIKGREMLRRAREKLSANLSQRHGEAIMRSVGDMPPVWGEFYIPFPGTIWQSPGRRRHVFCLFGDRGKLIYGFRWLDHGSWGKRGRLLRLRRSPAR